jgi:hypothetical protein
MLAGCFAEAEKRALEAIDARLRAQSAPAGSAATSRCSRGQGGAPFGMLRLEGTPQREGRRVQRGDQGSRLPYGRVSPDRGCTPLGSRKPGSSFFRRFRRVRGRGDTGRTTGVVTWRSDRPEWGIVAPLLSEGRVDRSRARRSRARGRSRRPSLRSQTGECHQRRWPDLRPSNEQGPGAWTRHRTSLRCWLEVGKPLGPTSCLVRP